VSGRPSKEVPSRQEAGAFSTLVTCSASDGGNTFSLTTTYATADRCEQQDDEEGHDGAARAVARDDGAGYRADAGKDSG